MTWIILGIGDEERIKLRKQFYPNGAYLSVGEDNKQNQWINYIISVGATEMKKTGKGNRAHWSGAVSDREIRKDLTWTVPFEQT